MRGDDEHPTTEPHEDGLSPLGPPAWAAYMAARRRYFATLALEGLERALEAPAARERAVGEGGG